MRAVIDLLGVLAGALAGTGLVMFGGGFAASALQRLYESLVSAVKREAVCEVMQRLGYEVGWMERKLAGGDGGEGAALFAKALGESLVDRRGFVRDDVERRYADLIRESVEVVSDVTVDVYPPASVAVIDGETA